MVEAVVVQAPLERDDWKSRILNGAAGSIDVATQRVTSVVQLRAGQQAVSLVSLRSDPQQVEVEGSRQQEEGSRLQVEESRLQLVQGLLQESQESQESGIRSHRSLRSHRHDHRARTSGTPATCN